MNWGARFQRIDVRSNIDNVGLIIRVGLEFLVHFIRTSSISTTLSLEQLKDLGALEALKPCPLLEKKRP